MNFSKREREYIEEVLEKISQGEYRDSRLFKYSVPPLKSAVLISENNPEDENVIMFEPIQLFLERLNKLINKEE